MKKIATFSILTAFCLSLAACTTVPSPQSDLTPPRQRLDAKTDLEYGKVSRQNRS